MKGCYKGVLCRLTEYRAMGKTAPALSYISSPDQETMLRAGFTEVRNGLWLKLLRQMSLRKSRRSLKSPAGPRIRIKNKTPRGRLIFAVM